MRRGFVRKTGGVGAEAGGEQGFWPSYADMMSSVALILFFLMLISYIQNLVTGNDLQNTQEVLATTKTEVEDALLKLSSLTDELALKEVELDENAKELALQTETIDAQKDLIGQQEKYLTSANKELVDMRNQMQTIAVLRLSILEQIRESIVGVMGDASKVTIGDNGNIILGEGVFFDLGSAEIKPASQAVLDELIDVFSTFLSDPENSKYVDSIVISGHTDTIGDAVSNRKLSTERANSVLNYMLAGRNAKLNAYSQFFCAAGYGQTRPVADNATEEGKAANRRIEISIILRDETVLKIVDDYLKVELPTDPANTATPTPSATPAP